MEHCLRNTGGETIRQVNGSANGCGERTATRLAGDLRRFFSMAKIAGNPLENLE